jgi:hypothetical protein
MLKDTLVVYIGSDGKPSAGTASACEYKIRKKAAALRAGAHEEGEGA